MVPRRVVPDVLPNQSCRLFQLALLPQPEPPHQPLPVRPDVVVLGVLLEHLAYEVRLADRGAELVDDELPMVPDLVVFLVRDGRFVQPVEFFVEVCLSCFEDARAVKPCESLLLARRT